MSSDRSTHRLRRAAISLALLACGVFLFRALVPRIGNAQSVTVTVAPDKQYQTQKYAMAYAASNNGNFGVWPDWPSIKPAYIDALLTQLGVNTLQLAEQVGDIENDQDYWSQPGNTFMPHRFIPVNDDSDPNHFACADQTLVNCPNSFPLSQYDYVMNTYWTGADGMRAKLLAAGKTPHLELLIVDWSTSSTYLDQSPQEYAEEVAAVFIHSQNKFGVVPDILSVQNEPDNHCAEAPSACMGGGVWTYAKLGAVLAESRRRLATLGYHPTIWCCDTTSYSDAVAWYNGVKSVVGAGVINAITSHHYSGSVSDMQATGAAAMNDGIDHVMTELDTGDIRDAFAVAKNARGAGYERYTDSTGGLGLYCETLLNILRANPLSLAFTAGNENCTAAGPAWFFGQLWPYTPEGAVRVDAGVSDTVNYDALAYRQPNGQYAVIVTTTRSNANPVITVAGLPAGQYGCTYTRDNSWFQQPCGSPQTIKAGDTISYPLTLAGLAGSGPVTAAMTVYGIGASQIAISCTPGSLQFVGSATHGGIRGGRPERPSRSESCAVTSSPSGLSLSSSVVTASGGSWLAAALTTNAAPATLMVSVNTAGLAAGIYQGSIVISSPGAAAVTIPVTLTVPAAPGN